MDFRLFFKNKFLQKSFGDFVKSLDGSSYSEFKETLKTNRSWYVPSSIFNSQDAVIHKLFNSIDGSNLKRTGNGELKNEYGNKNNRLEASELYDWVKYNYKIYKGKEISDEELANMKMSDFMNYVEDFLNKGFKLE